MASIKTKKNIPNPKQTFDLPFFYLVVFLKTKLHVPPLKHKIPSNL